MVGLTEQNYIVSFGGNAVIMAIKGLFDGSFFNVISVMFVSWVAVLPLLLSSLLITVNNETDKRILLFLKMTEVVCILIYVGGIYLFSFQGYWWVGMAKDSLVRSSSCLIVIPLLIFGIKLKEYAKKYIR